MLKILPHDSVDFDRGVVLADAYDVKVSRGINSEHRLEFSCAAPSYAELIEENKIAVCEGQAYRIMRISRERGAHDIIKAQCEHLYSADAPNVHLQNVPDMIGVPPSAVLEYAFSGTRFSLFTESELSAMGMTSIDSGGFLIDFFSVDKTNPYEVVKMVIESCGKGELYADNYKIALVERIGSDKNVRLDLRKNMPRINIERDISDMVTVLYPYGKDDLHIGSVNNGVQYIRSSSADIYGEREGYRDFSEYTEPDILMRRALWEFDCANRDRIDVPCINITGDFADISRLAEYGEGERVEIGDGVAVIDGDNEIYERVIHIEYYPYQNNETVISIGRVKKDLFFYLDQMGTLTKRYSKSSTVSGKVRAKAVTGVISNSGLELTSDLGGLSILSDIIKVTTQGKLRARIGNEGGRFVCNITDSSGGSVIETDADGGMRISVKSIRIGTNEISADTDGSLCVNGRKIAYETNGGETNE